MNQAAPFQTSITYVGGRLVVVSREGEGYRFSPEQLHRMLSFFDLMLAWARSEPRSIDVGPYHCTPTGECHIALPFQFADKTTVLVQVAPDWLELMRPVFTRAQAKLADPGMQPAPDFTLALKQDGSIEELPPDRTTLRPA